MATAQDTYGAVFKNGSAILLARVVGAEGTAITLSDVSTLQYSVLQLDDSQPDLTSAVAGHDGVMLPKTSVLFDQLQTDALWTVDATGYNFRHEIDVSGNEAFPQAGGTYQVRYEVMPASGQKMVFRFQLRAI